MQQLDHSPALDSEQAACYVYNSETRHIAIESWRPASFSCPTSALVVLGGLTDGPMALPYTKQLLLTLNTEGRSCCIVQPVLSSSYLGYGNSSIEQDCRELDTLVGFLVNERSKQRVVLLGHSTGAQIVLRYLSGFSVPAGSPTPHPAVAGGVLQGPVSDRQYMMAATPELVSKYRPIALQLCADGRGQELLPREVDPAPMTAQRFVSLSGQQTPDDLFSTDLPPSYLAEVYSRVQVPLCVLLSEAEEYLPASVSVQELKERVFVHVRGDVVVLAGANHAVSNSQDARDQLCAAVAAYVQRVGGGLS